MKKLLLLLFLTLFMCSTCFSQFVVMGIDIDCSKKQAIERFRSAGYSITNNEYVRGSFWGHEGIIQLTEKNGYVGWAGIFLLPIGEDQSYSNWGQLKNDMLAIANTIKKQYGKDPIQIFEFQKPYKEGDGHEFEAIRKDKASISITFVDPSEKEGVFGIKLYPSNIDDGMYIIAHYYGTRFGLSNLN